MPRSSRDTTRTRWDSSSTRCSSGGNKLQKFLAPKYVGAGAFFLGAQDRPLISPLEKGHRTGGFLDWGPAHAGFTFGRDWRGVIGVGKQILPYLF